jgi:Xaa-Pro aminopeptidase
MKKKGVDALIASTQANCYYASGYKARVSERPIMAVVPADPSLAPAMVVGSFIERQARKKSQIIEDIRTYPMWVCMVNGDDVIKGTAKPSKPPEQFSRDDVFGILTDIFKEKGLQEGTIGIEQNLLGPPAYSVLSRQNPNATFVEAESIFWELRKVKTDEEIEALRMSAKLGVKGIRGLMEGNPLGASISELQRRYKVAALQGTAEGIPVELDFLHVLIAAGDPMTMEFPEYRVKKGDAIFIDAGVQTLGYNSDMGRTFVAGKPSDLLQDIYGALLAGYEEGLSKVRPGVELRELYRIIHDTVRKNGLDWFARGHTGHRLA